MKTTRFISLLCFMILTKVSYAYDAYIDGIYYNFSGDEAIVTYRNTDYKSYSGSISIPSKVRYNDKTYSVTSIGDYAFNKCSGLTSITIPNSVTSIGRDAFYNCSGLTSVTIPNSVTSIGRYAFSGCFGLTSATIPNSVTSIGQDAFRDCSGLTSVTIGNGVTSIGDRTFSDCSSLTSLKVEEGNPKYDSRNNCNAIIESSTNTLIAGCKTTTIPNSVTSIGNYAFYGCSGLTSITIPESVTSIGESAFYYCSGLTSVTIPNSVISIGQQAFSGCSGLTSITIPNSVISIGQQAFSGCSNLTKAEFASIESLCKIKFEDTFPQSNPLFYAKHLYINGQEITDLVIPNGVTSIGAQAFYGCTGLTSATIPNSVTSIGKYAFNKCSGLTSVTIPNSVTSIGSGAFAGTAWDDNLPDGLIYAGKVAYKYKGTMPSGTSITLDEGTLGIADYAFNNCKSLSSVIIPNSVVSIGERAFYNCSGLTSITIPESVTSIGESAFFRCSGLTSVTIPESVTSIGSNVFYNCSSLTSVTIPNSVTSIGSSAFYNCRGLTSIIIPENVVSIGSSAFNNCSGLTSITIPNSVTSIGQQALSGCSNLTKAEFASIESLCKIEFENANANPLYYTKHLYINGQEITELVIPNGVTSIGSYAFYNCSGLTSITIPNSVTSIGVEPFYNCTSLSKADFANIECLCKVKSALYYTNRLYINGQEITELVIPNSVTSIESGTFSGCNDLTSVTIPSSVTNIGSSAFQDCPLQTIINYGNKDIVDNTFSQATKQHAQLYVPEGTIWDYIYNTRWTQFYHIKEFASTPDDIRNDAVYMIADQSGRNFPVYNQMTKSLKNVAYTLNLDDNDAGTCWQVIEDDGDTYLYNIGAGMYAEYDEENNLSLSKAPAAVDIKVTEDGTTINGKPVMLVANKSVAPVEAPKYILGDANVNCEVEIGDVTSVLTLMATPEVKGYNKKAADANGNGEIEIGDVTTILTIMAGN